MQNDLKKSGLYPASIKKLKTVKLTSAQTLKLVNDFEVPSYKIPYFDFNGKPTGYYRLKLLEQPKVFGQELKQKYWQPKKSLPAAYFPPLMDWLKVINDNAYTIAITEGEKKAALLTQYGMPTIGLGGVWSFKSKKLNIEFLEELEQIKWEDREVEIVFDNDIQSNDKVHHAMVRLAEALLKRGAFVYIRYIPEDEEGTKIGIDDYLLQYTKKTEAQAAYEDLEIEEFETSSQLHQLNNEVFYLKSHTQYYDITHQVFYNSPAQGAATAFAARNYTLMIGDTEKEVNAFKEWCKWPNRREYNKLVYEPNLALVDDHDYNGYRGLAVEPEEGDVQPFLDLFELVFGDLEPENKLWLWQWFAYPFQNPGTKLYTAVIVATNKQGFGKSFIGQIIGKIYGDNFSEINHDQLDSDFNGWAKYKQFILGDEVLDTGRRAQADRIKNMITRETILINDKNDKLLPIRDCINWYFTSNHSDAMYLTKDDRRAFVHFPRNDIASEAFYKRIEAWKNNGGAAHLLHYLLTQVDCKSFNPRAKAPMTSAKDEMIYQGYSDVDKFCSELQDNADYILNIGDVKMKSELYTASQLLEIYKAYTSDNRTTLTAFSKSLRNVTEFAFKSQVVTKSKGNQRLVAVKNAKRWKKLNSTVWRNHFDEHNKYIDKRESKAITKKSKVVNIKQRGKKR